MEEEKKGRVWRKRREGGKEERQGWRAGRGDGAEWADGQGREKDKRELREGGKKGK